MSTLVSARVAQLLLLGFSGLCSSLVFAAWGKEDVAPYTAPEGLTEVKVKGFAKTFVRREANISQLRRVCVRSGEFSLSKRWIEDSFQRRLRTNDREHIQRVYTAAAVGDFARPFDNEGGYVLVSTVTDAAGGGAPPNCELTLVVNVLDFFLNAPSLPTADNKKEYARSIGSITLRVDVIDSTGTILLAQAYARRNDPEKTGLGRGLDGISSAASASDLQRLRVTEFDNVNFTRDAARLIAERVRTRILSQY
jgi:hypothetical protein